MTGPIHQFDENYGSAGNGRSPRRSVERRSRSAGEEPRIGVLYNPRSHRNKGRDLMPAAMPNVTVGLPHGRERIAEVLEGFVAKGLDLLVINGGDGTVRDVLTCGLEVFGEDWPEIAVLPKGKTNALNVDLGAPAGWNLVDAIEAYGTGRRIIRSPLLIERIDGSGGPVLGFILGAGVFTTAVKAGQDAHRMGAFNSLAVGVTTAWGVAQILLGTDGNPWRRGGGMKIDLLPTGETLSRSKFGEAERRTMMLASTLERFPMGAQIFGDARGPVKLAVLDHPRRRLMALLPAIMAGYRPAWLADAGLHQLAAEAFEMDLADAFILDGEAFPPGRYRVSKGPELTFVVP